MCPGKKDTVTINKIKETKNVFEWQHQQILQKIQIFTSFLFYGLYCFLQISYVLDSKSCIIWERYLYVCHT